MSINGKAESKYKLRGEVAMPDMIVGKSAYEIAVMHGFKGSETEWLASLHGKDGKDGDDTYANIVFADSFEDLPDDVPNGTLGVVPSRGGMGGICYEVIIPSASDTDKKGWLPTYNGYELLIADLPLVKADSFIELKCENAEIFIDLDLIVTQGEGSLAFNINSLPDAECILYVVVPSYKVVGSLNGGGA